MYSDFGNWRAAFVVQVQCGNYSLNIVLPLCEENWFASMHRLGVSFLYFVYLYVNIHLL